MKLRSVFLACATTLIVSVNSQAAYYSGVDASHSFSGYIGTDSDATSGKSVVDEMDGIMIYVPPKGLLLEGKYELAKQDENTIWSFLATTQTAGGVGEEVGFSFSATFEFTLDQAISATAIVSSMGYNQGPVAGTYTMTVNGNSVPLGAFTNVNLLQGSNQIVVTGILESSSLAFDLWETGGGYLIFGADPAPVPEPGSWALMAFGGLAFIAARRKFSRARVS